MPSAKRVIGVIDHTWDEAHIYYARLAVGLCAKVRGYDVVAARSVEMLPKRDLAGVIYRRRSRNDTREISCILDLGIPYVFLNSFSEEHPTVNTNFEAGTVEAVAHLKELRRRKIAYVSGSEALFTSPQRLAGYLAAMERNGMPLDTQLIVEADFGYDLARERVVELLGNFSDVDAIVCCSDRAAMGAIHAAKQCGRRVPEDVAVIGCGNLPEIQQLSDHPLSTISDALFFIAYLAAEKLVRILEDKEDKAVVETVDSNLVKRQSTLGGHYIDPLMGAHFQKGPQALDYILSVGSTLEKEMRSSLIENFAVLREEGAGLLAALRSTLLLAISKGFDASLAHFLLQRLESQLDGNEERDSEISDAVFEVSSNEVTRYGIHSRAVEMEIEAMMGPLLERKNAVVTIDALLEILLELVRNMECRFMGLLVFDNPVSDLSQLPDETGRYWEVDTNGVSQAEVMRFRDLSPFDDFRKGKRGSLLIEQMDLEGEGGIAAFLFIDIDTVFGPLSKGLKVSLENRLQHIRLFDSLEASHVELKRQKQIAEHANSAKTEFLAVVSHELRTPLNCIMGMTELTLKTDLDKQQESFLRLAFQASKDQLSLVNDILDFSKIESGGMEIKNEAFLLEDSIRHVSDVMRMRALDKGLDFEVTRSDDLPQKVMGDEHCIHQVITNIVGNATKFTPAGKVSLRISLKSMIGDQAVIRFEVEDTGLGIPKSKLASIFNAFEQVDTSSTRDIEGVGLGLAIVKKTLDQVGGSVFVRSEYGAGSCFTVEIPLKVLAERELIALGDEDVEEIEEEHEAAMRVLVVDDSESNLLVSRSILEREGHDVMVSDSGEGALEILKSNTFDLILMDIKMPGMDGREVTREIRRLEAAAVGALRIPILAVSAHVQDEDRRQCMESGMDGFASKPVTRERLLDKIDEVCRLQD